MKKDIDLDTVMADYVKSVINNLFLDLDAEHGISKQENDYLLTQVDSIGDDLTDYACVLIEKLLTTYNEGN